MIWQTLLLGLLLLLSCFGPGFLVVRRLRWDPVEKFTASIALSLVIVYLLAFASFWIGLSAAANFAISLACGVATAATYRDARRLFQSARLRRAVVAFGWLLLWTIGTLLLIRHYSGGEHCCDWVEHYQRSMNFVEPKPDDFLYIGRYLLTARPPLMNLLTGHFLAQVGTDFALYQIVFSVLNVSVFFPCCLIARLVSRRGLRYGLLAVVLGANPMFFMNTTYAWTRVLTAMFVLLAVWFYLSGWRKRDSIRLSAAFLSVAAGCLVHFSAAPFGLFLGLHYLIAVWPFRARRLLELLGAVVPAAALLATWFGWAIARYGVRGTFLRNTSVAGTAPLGLQENLAKIGGNIWDSLRPHIFAGQPVDGPLRLLIDRVFMLYQVNLLLAMGSVGFLITGWLVVQAMRPSESRLPSRERRWWALFIPFEVVIGIAVVGERIHSGLAHICLQPLVYIALVLVAAEFPRLPRPVGLLLWLGLCVDFSLGVVLELYMEHAMEPWARSPNWDWKASEGLVYLGDRALAWALPVALALCAGALAVSASAARRFLLTRGSS